MVKLRVFLPALVAALLPPMALAQSAPDKAMQLLQIVADQQTGGGHAVITVGALGPDLPKIPLPNAEIIGTIQGTGAGELRSLVGSSSTLYYRASAAQVTAYGETLAEAGWKAQALPGRGGFVSNGTADVSIYCRAGEPTVTTTTGAGEHPHLSVTVMSGSAATMICSAGSMVNMMKALSPSFDAPLPTLKAPPGSKMEAELTTASLGRSAARISDASDTASLLENFAGQFTSAGWTAGPKAVASDVASQTFTRTVDNHEWECALTIYPESGKPGTYLASIVPTNLTGPK